jgi:chromosome segregation ATPase
MRIERLSVQRFQGIESAELELGPGLNVLYGPNDLGKSSLAWAIRAVLLLQHNSAQHERFVSWYGGGEPRVALTLSDDDGRFWRVTKTFGSGGAGRSLLETSKDGRTFQSDASARQVDDKLRQMLGWGVQRAGAGARGFPESFLTQVLLAEQDNVRTILFDTSLVDDADESGRGRLTAALGALAQDPLFKQVLDGAQASVDEAFTATGQRKRGASSPFKEVVDYQKRLALELDELEAKVRDTTAAEDRVRQLIIERDDVHQQLDLGQEALTTAERQLAARQRRDALHDEVQRHLARVREVEALRRRIDETTLDVTGRAAAAEVAAERAREAAAMLEVREASRDQARRELDALAHDDESSQRAARELEAAAAAAREQLHEAERAVERRGGALRAAVEIARGFAEASAEVERAGGELQVADVAAAAAAAEVARAQNELEGARQRLRDATSGDRAQARELQRRGLENQRLAREAARAETERRRERARQVAAMVAKAAEARAAHDAAVAQIAGDRQAMAAAQATLSELDDALGGLRRLETFGQLRAAQQAAAQAAQAAAAAEASRADAVRLRAEAAGLEGAVRRGLPTAGEIARIRALREDLRVAEARLGGGVTVTLRPTRPLAMVATVDGAVVADDKAADAARTFSANRSIALRIGDLVEVEVVAGEASARTAAASLRDRWEAEGARHLREHGVETVAQLEALQQAADEAQRAAQDRRRDAERAEAQAAQAATSAAVPGLDERIGALRAELGGADVGELGRTLERLGVSWQATLKQRIADRERDRQHQLTELERHRDQVARLEAQLDERGRAADTLLAEASSAEVELGAPWREAVARLDGELAASDAELVALDRALAAATTADSGEESAARAAVATAEQALAAAEAQRDQRTARALAARDGSVQARARRDEAVARARDLDGAAAWQPLLDGAGGALPVDSWRAALAAAEAQRDAARAELESVRARVEQLAGERALRVQRAREAAESAEAAVKDARSRCDTGRAELATAADALATAKALLAELRLEAAHASVDDAQRAIAALRQQMSALEGEAGDVDPEAVTALRAQVARSAAHARELDEELARARGALEQVGGAIVREKKREVEKALQQARERHHALEVEYDAWKLLVETMRACEATEGAHLGKALAGPVSKRFRQLTEGRYGDLELGAHLEATGVHAAGDVRPIAALSAGTQDQLATLLRLCIAEQLRSAIVLDDHLTHSDASRIGWFNAVLRAAAPQVQIILITCRPSEVLSPDELPVDGEAVRVAAAGLLRAVDLNRVIRRFASTTGGATAQRPPEPRVDERQLR